MKPPSHIKGAEVIYYSLIDARHKATAICVHTVDGKQVGAAAGLAVCKYPGYPGAILYYCDEHWQAMTHGHHASVEDAKEQAAFEYEGVEDTWESLNYGE
jgi:hypothetical protein